MTFSIVGRCARTGMLGAAVTTSSISVGSRCSHARAGIGAALEQAQRAAGGRDVSLGGGADTARQYLAAGLAVATTPLPRAAEIVRTSGGGVVVRDAAALSATLRNWAAHPEELDPVRAAAARWAREAFAGTSGYDELAGRLEAAGHRDTLGAVGRLADDLDVGLMVEEHLQPHAYDRVVVDDEDADRGGIGHVDSWGRVGVGRGCGRGMRGARRV